MTKTLRLGEDLTLPLDAVTQTFGILAIARVVWPGFDELPVDVAKLRLLRVDEVLSGRGCPTISRKDFEAVYAAALEIP